jgi:hypothetical protein
MQRTSRLSRPVPPVRQDGPGGSTLSGRFRRRFRLSNVQRAWIWRRAVPDRHARSGFGDGGAAGSAGSAPGNPDPPLGQGVFSFVANQAGPPHGLPGRSVRPPGTGGGWMRSGPTSRHFTGRPPTRRPAPDASSRGRAGRGPRGAECATRRLCAPLNLRGVVDTGSYDVDNDGDRVNGKLTGRHGLSSRNLGGYRKRSGFQSAPGGQAW